MLIVTSTLGPLLLGLSAPLWRRSFMRSLDTTRLPRGLSHRPPANIWNGEFICAPGQRFRQRGQKSEGPS